MSNALQDFLSAGSRSSEPITAVTIAYDVGEVTHELPGRMKRVAELDRPYDQRAQQRRQVSFLIEAALILVPIKEGMSLRAAGKSCRVTKIEPVDADGFTRYICTTT